MSLWLILWAAPPFLTLAPPGPPLAEANFGFACGSDGLAQTWARRAQNAGLVAQARFDGTLWLTLHSRPEHLDADIARLLALPEGIKQAPRTPEQHVLAALLPNEPCPHREDGFWAQSATTAKEALTAWERLPAFASKFEVVVPTLILLDAPQADHYQVWVGKRLDGNPNIFYSIDPVLPPGIRIHWRPDQRVVVRRWRARTVEKALQEPPGPAWDDRAALAARRLQVIGALQTRAGYAGQAALQRWSRGEASDRSEPASDVTEAQQRVAWASLWGPAEVVLIQGPQATRSAAALKAQTGARRVVVASQDPDAW